MPLTYFGLVIAEWGESEASPHHTFFSGKKLLCIDLKLGTHTKQLKNFQKGPKAY